VLLMQISMQQVTIFFDRPGAGLVWFSRVEEPQNEEHDLERDRGPLQGPI
jgi:hypothetical protein